MKIDLDKSVVVPGTGWMGNCIVSVQPGNKIDPVTCLPKLVARIIDAGGRTFPELPHSDEILVRRSYRKSRSDGEYYPSYRLVPRYGDRGIQEFLRNLFNGTVGYGD